MHKLEHNPTLWVEPHHWEGGVPVFCPSEAEFANFYSFNKAINKFGMQSGIVKVVPPRAWNKTVQRCYNESTLDNIKIKNPIVQHINGSSNGVYSQQNIERTRSYSIYQWKELSEKSNHQPPAHRGKAKGNGSSNEKPHGKPSEKATERADRRKHHPSKKEVVSCADDFTTERCEELEKVYWKSLTYAEPMYGADVLGSLFNKGIKSWNVAALPNILDLMETKLPGVNDAYLYAGLWKATFAWHLEDQDLYSINYIHFGAPKQWYSIPQEDAGRFYDLMKDTFTEEHRACSEFLRHKTFLVSPQFLEKHNIRCNRIVHNQGEFMITYPYGYHAGFNYGYNLAESVNFALDDWFPIGKVTKKCECISDSVGINVEELLCKFKGVPYVYQLPEEESESLETEEPEEVEPRAEGTDRPTGRKRPRSRTATRSFPSECALCPLEVPDPFKISSFQLVEAHSAKLKQPLKVHKLCSQMFPEQLSVENGIVVGLESISAAQKSLNCSFCSQKSGVCFQCSHPKCFRLFHGCCGIFGGVAYGQQTASLKSNLCHLHRPKNTDPAELSAVPRGAVVQFRMNTGSKKILSGYVVSNSPNEESMDIVALFGNEPPVEVFYADILDGCFDMGITDAAIVSRIESAKNAGIRKVPPKTTKNKKIKLESPDDDRQVTGVLDSRLALTINDTYITEVGTYYTLTHIQPHFSFWHFLPELSSREIARYTSDHRSRVPNDERYLRSRKRLAHKTSPPAVGAMRYSHFMPQMAWGPLRMPAVGTVPMRQPVPGMAPIQPGVAERQMTPVPHLVPHHHDPQLNGVAHMRPEIHH